MEDQASVWFQLVQSRFLPEAILKVKLLYALITGCQNVRFKRFAIVCHSWHSIKAVIFYIKKVKVKAVDLYCASSWTP